MLPKTIPEGFRYQYVINHNLKWEGNSSDETLFANKHNLKSDWTYTWFSNTCAQFYSPSADNYSNKDSYPFGTGWGAGPVSPAMVNEWKDWAAKQTYTDGYKEDPRSDRFHMVVTKHLIRMLPATY
mgnify:CR=1 FL=1